MRTLLPQTRPEEAVKAAERLPSSFPYAATTAFKTQQKPACATAIRKVTQHRLLWIKLTVHSKTVQ